MTYPRRKCCSLCPEFLSWIMRPSDGKTAVRAGMQPPSGLWDNASHQGAGPVRPVILSVCVPLNSTHPCQAPSLWSGTFSCQALHFPLHSGIFLLVGDSFCQASHLVVFIPVRYRHPLLSSRRILSCQAFSLQHGPYSPQTVAWHCMLIFKVVMDNLNC